MPVTNKKTWTYEDYYNLDDEKRYEVMEGELIEMAPAPNYSHQRISGNLHGLLWNYVRKNKLGDIVTAPTDVILDELNTFQPDIIFISNENQKIIQECGVFGSPDLLVEILSKSTKSKDRGVKYKAYQNFGVKEYWIIDPMKRTVEVFVLENAKYLSHCLVQNNEKLQSRIFPDFAVSFSDLL